MPKKQKKKASTGLEMKALRRIPRANIFRPDQLEGCGCGDFIMPGDSFEAPSQKISDQLKTAGAAE